MDNKEQKLETARAKLDIKRLRTTRFWWRARSWLPAALYLWRRGLKETMEQMLRNFLKKGLSKVCILHLERNWLSQGKTSSGYVKDGVERI